MKFSVLSLLSILIAASQAVIAQADTDFTLEKRSPQGGRFDGGLEGFIKGGSEDPSFPGTEASEPSSTTGFPTPDSSISTTTTTGLPTPDSSISTTTTTGLPTPDSSISAGNYNRTPNTSQ
ncbi:hypothetical protein BSLG_005833 [Batrachochytrium salamandrivorans]|nr:hypothetical protein BSLG_005833 [Batrachochytrium salamandrivorans]